jgi:hypothetical protein
MNFGFAVQQVQVLPDQSLARQVGSQSGSGSGNEAVDA